MDINLVIAENLKRIRKTQKRSMEQTALCAGVSKSMLGQIERGEANPSAALLGKLAAALKVSVEELLHAEAALDVTPLRALDSTAQREDGGKVLIHTVFPFDPTLRTEQRRLDIFISGHYAPLPEKPGCIGYLTVLGGSLEVEANGESCRLEQWDGLRFYADRPYALRNDTNATARVMIGYLYTK